MDRGHTLKQEPLPARDAVRPGEMMRGTVPVTLHTCISTGHGHVVIVTKFQVMVPTSKVWQGEGLSKLTQAGREEELGFASRES